MDEKVVDLCRKADAAAENEVMMCLLVWLFMLLVVGGGFVLAIYQVLFCYKGGVG